MAPKPTQIVFDQWETYISHWDDKPVFISFDVEAAEKDLTGTLANCARVIIPIKRPNDNGGPVSPEAEQLYELEDELCGLLAENEVRCRLVGRLTCDGVRELVFQLDDWDSFRPPVGFWMGNHDDYAIDVSEHDGWEFFNDCIRPTQEIWLYLADQSVVRNLLKAGSNPAKEHALEFVFNGDSTGLRPVAAALRARGYVPQANAQLPADQIVMVKKMKLDEQAIYAESQAHLELAAKHGVAYDGWGAEVVR